ncbi:flagellar hook-associated protein FlgK [Fluviispira sanaruensis]|uniref:Flagellar hook-associated protein 1 n=1 Tax=Fluviispira sanaruensis TaxID=2493639 RepID=A0A4P2VTY7_FLUSA|nr:flagellar hook-associated protein FlgK [Fluviispira sanaruensis]BBH52352.1 flagellar hook-associated protein FlgK [Fluviispira sanaruensis]
MVATLNHILNLGSESLQNSRTGVDVTGHNISNAQTPGYSRQLVNLETKWPIEYGLHVFGDGARIQSIQRAHDKFIEGQLRREVQIQSKTEVLAEGLKKIESFFNPDLTSTVRDRFVSFMSSIRELANFPEEPSVRINMIENGKSLAQAFNAAHANIVQVQTDANEELKQTISVVNQKIAEVAKLNGQIREMGAGNLTDVNDLEDRRDKLIKEIGSIVDINAYHDKNDQITVRGPAECLLVEGNLASRFKIEDVYTPTHMPAILISEFEKERFFEMTDYISKGKMGALLDIRDRYAQRVRDDLNELAKGFADNFNEVHRKGFGINDMHNLNGRDFFAGLSGPGEPAQDLEVDLGIVFNPNAVGIAMSADTPGDNVVANQLIKLFYEPLFDNNTTTITGIYDKMISKIGIAALRTKEEATSSQIVYDRLKSQRESVSGVSLDDEAANLLKYQHLFTASSRVITTADEMFKTVLDLKR